MLKEVKTGHYKEIYNEMEKDISAFAKVVCKDLVKDEMPLFHYEIYDLIRDEELLALAAPRGFAKSSIVAKIYPLWLVLFKKRIDICIVSASEGLAVEHLRYIKMSLESNPYVIAGWGDLKSDKWTENHLIVKHPDGKIINIRAKGAGGQIRGFRPDCIILDDIETDDGVASEEQRKKLKNWLFKACLNTLLPGGQMLLIGTILHQLSLLNDLLNMPNKWVKRRYRAYVGKKQVEGEELWKEARPHKWLQERKATIGSTAFANEYMNDPKADEASPIKDEMIKYWNEIPSQISCVIAVDPAYSDSEQADFKVAVLVGIDSKNNRYLLDYIRTHSPQGDFIDQMLTMYVRNKGTITAVGVPGGREIDFFNKCTEKAMDRGLGVPFKELKNSFTTVSGITKRRKKDRIVAALQPLFEQGKYFINASHVEAREEILEIGFSRWDDIVDSMCYAEQILTPGLSFEQKYERSDYSDNFTRQRECYGIEY